MRLGRPAGRNIGGGLPRNPRARSAGPSDAREREKREYTASRARDTDYNPRQNTSTPPPTRSVRPQRSAANMAPSRGRSSSFTDVPEVPPLPLSRRSDVSSSSKSSASSGSYSSASGSGSSSTFLDRMKGLGRDYGYGSSRTSLEEDADQPPKAMGPERGGWFNQRSAAAMPESEYGMCLQSSVAAAC
jgi:hypothetical protein